MKKIIISIAAISTLFLASCAMDPSQKEEEALAKSFKPQPGRANVYAYRPRTWTPWVPTLYHLDLNGQNVSTAPDSDKKFVMFDVPPGQYTISAYQKHLLLGKLGVSDYKFTANPGENVFLRFHPIFRVDLIVVSTPVVSWSRATEAVGKEDILKAQLVKGIETVN